jgi:regulator of microtubule dynamics protein 3
MSTKDKIESAYKVKEYALKALAVDPHDASTLHVLGRWCFSVANVSWIERRLAATLIATPPESTFQEVGVAQYTTATQLCRV